MWLVTKQILHCWLLFHLEQQHICHKVLPPAPSRASGLTLWCLCEIVLFILLSVGVLRFFTLFCLFPSISALCTMVSVSLDNHSWFPLSFSFYLRLLYIVSEFFNDLMTLTQTQSWVTSIDIFLTKILLWSSLLPLITRNDISKHTLENIKRAINNIQFNNIQQTTLENQITERVKKQQKPKHRKMK